MTTLLYLLLLLVPDRIPLGPEAQLPPPSPADFIGQWRSECGFVVTKISWAEDGSVILSSERWGWSGIGRIDGDILTAQYNQPPGQHVGMLWVDRKSGDLTGFHCDWQHFAGKYTDAGKRHLTIFKRVRSDR